MSELEEFFGERVDQDTGEITKKRNWSGVPEHIQDVCIAYEEALRESGFEGRLGPYLTKLIKVGARDWYREYGVDPARMKWAMRYARSQQPPLIVKSPKSLIVIGQEYQPHKQDDRKRYTGGKYGQYVES